MTSVYVTIPNGSGWVHKTVFFAAIKMLQDRRYTIRLDAPTHSPYVNNLHRCCIDFLKGGEDFWLSLDDDNAPIRNPLDLIEYDLDVVGLPTPVWCNKKPGDRPYYFNALTWAEKEQAYRPHENMNGLQEVDAIGSGCMLIARRVILELKGQQPFMRKWNRDGTVDVGCDYSFCQKVKKANFKVWAHFGYPCHHFNEVSLIEVIEAFNEMQT